MDGGGGGMMGGDSQAAGVFAPPPGKQGWRMNECVHYREIKTTACLSLSISAFTLSSFLLLRSSLWPQVVLQSQTLFFLVLFLALPHCRSATQHQPTLQHYLCCYGNCNTCFFPRRNDTTKRNQLGTFNVYDRLRHSTHWFVFSFLTENMKRAHLWWWQVNV